MLLQMILRRMSSGGFSLSAVELREYIAGKEASTERPEVVTWWSYPLASRRPARMFADFTAIS
jgi:hypothetical protein